MCVCVCVCTCVCMCVCAGECVCVHVQVRVRARLHMPGTHEKASTSTYARVCASRVLCMQIFYQKGKTLFTCLWRTDVGAAWLEHHSPTLTKFLLTNTGC